MKIDSGRYAVWSHAGEAGLQDAIKKIAEFFPIDDIAIHTLGKLTYLKEQPRPPRLRVGLKVNPVTGRLIK